MRFGGSEQGSTTGSVRESNPAGWGLRSLETEVIGFGSETAPAGKHAIIQSAGEPLLEPQIPDLPSPQEGVRRESAEPTWRTPEVIWGQHLIVRMKLVGCGRLSDPGPYFLDRKEITAEGFATLSAEDRSNVYILRDVDGFIIAEMLLADWLGAKKYPYAYRPDGDVDEFYRQAREEAARKRPGDLVKSTNRADLTHQQRLVGWVEAGFGRQADGTVRCGSHFVDHSEPEWF